MQGHTLSTARRPSPAAPPLSAPQRPRRLYIAVAIAALVIANLATWQFTRNDVLDAALAYPDGGGYCALNDTGVPETIKHAGAVILPASKGGSYCCGFTFALAMKTARQRGLLADKSAAQVRQFQREWYGATEGTEWRECAAAVVNLGIGAEIPHDDARPGDFATFQRKNAPGHSVIFLGWMTDSHGAILGIRYRSSQPSTGGVGDKIEYFDDTHIQGKGIDRQRLYFARLNTGWWWRITHPFGA